jgi:UDP-N-acetyl-D-glucosamine dehydrogenase
VHLFGVAYKPDVGDVRESPAIDIIGLLHRRGAIVSYTDPYVPTLREGSSCLEGIDADTAFARGIDCAVITTNHRCFDYPALAARSPLIVDTRNALRGVQGAHVFRL